MDLFAKEFVACRVQNPGVLILSPFTGNEELMQEALFANPYEISDTAAVLHRFVFEYCLFLHILRHFEDFFQNQRDIRIFSVKLNFWLRDNYDPDN